MKTYPQSMLNLMRELERIAHFILRLPHEEAMQLAVVIRNVKQNVSYNRRDSW